MQRIVPSSRTAGVFPVAAMAGRDDLQALGWALMLELLLLAGTVVLIHVVSYFHTEVMAKAPTTIQLNDLPDEPKPALPPPPVPKRVEKAVPQPVQPPVMPKAPESPPPVPVPEATPSPFAEKPTPPLPPPTPPSHSQADPMETYRALVKAAVQAALVYPEAAGDMRFTGRSRVRFHLQQGLQSGALILVSCGVNMLDRAALQAVRSARYPAPPEGLGDQDRSFEVWVEFRQ